MLRRIDILIPVLAVFGILNAAPVGNTSAPELIQKGLVISCDSWIDFRAGYEGDFVADGRMTQYEQGFGRLDNYQQWTNSGTATLNVLDRLDLYAVFGSSRTEADWRFNDASAGTVARIELKTEDCFLWAAGARAILYEWGNASLGLGGRYSSCNYLPESLASNGRSQPVNGSQFFWKEWQINFDASYKIHLFTPYIGIKYLNARTQLKDFLVPISASLSGSNSFRNRIPVGLYLGCTLSNRHYFMLNLEGRLVDEEAITISADFRF
jgi:hypothetical protein